MPNQQEILCKITLFLGCCYLKLSSFLALETWHVSSSQVTDFSPGLSENASRTNIHLCALNPRKVSNLWQTVKLLWFVPYFALSQAAQVVTPCGHPCPTIPIIPGKHRLFLEESQAPWLRVEWTLPIWAEPRSTEARKPQLSLFFSYSENCCLLPGYAVLRSNWTHNRVFWYKMSTGFHVFWYDTVIQVHWALVGVMSRQLTWSS